MDYLIGPTTILTLCVLAGIGTVLLLPSPRRNASHRIGAVLAAAALLIGVARLVRASAGNDLSGAGPYFWIFSAIALVAAVRVISHPRPVYSALYFVLTVLASAGLFVLLDAEFMAAALILIYAGAILITYIFVIMLAATAQAPVGTKPLSHLAECDVTSREPFIAACIGFALMGVLMFLIFDKAGSIAAPIAKPPGVEAAAAVEQPNIGNTQLLGRYLFENQLVNLELAGVILTLSMAGAIVIARRRVTDINAAFEPPAESLPASPAPVDDDPHMIPVTGVMAHNPNPFGEQ